jgi:hypothetical protein
MEEDSTRFTWSLGTKLRALRLCAATGIFLKAALKKRPLYFPWLPRYGGCGCVARCDPARAETLYGG